MVIFLFVYQWKTTFYKLMTKLTVYLMYFKYLTHRPESDIEIIFIKLICRSYVIVAGLDYFWIKMVYN